MKLRPLLLLALAALVDRAAAAQLVITVRHDLPIARPAETVAVPWTEVNAALPGALLQKLVVKDAGGRVRPYQVTNVAPQAKDPEKRGAAYGELLFQHDFPAGEQEAVFTVETSDEVAPVFPVRAFARAVPERLDDFAWENDRIAHRTYGPALAAADDAKAGKEVLVTSGLDVWCKRVAYPIVDRWYNKGHDHYHVDEGEGMDMYQVGQSRGCGGTGVWDGARLHVGRNYRTSRVIANGPIRAVFELTYDTWAANGLQVSETKRFTVDAGHNLDRIDSTFVVTGGKEITVGIGLNKTPADKGQDAHVTHFPEKTDGSLAQWIVQKINGDLGTAVLVASDAWTGFAEDERNQLVLARAVSGQSFTYYAGAAWSRSGHFTTAQAWRDHVAAAAARARSPLRVSVGRQP